MSTGDVANEDRHRRRKHGERRRGQFPPKAPPPQPGMRSGERQVAPTLKGIRRDHVARYEWAVRHLGKADRVIDFACGVGYGTKILAGAAQVAVGFDRDGEALEYAKRHYQSPHLDIAYRRMDGDAPGALGTADAAVCFETIEHLEDPRPLLRRLHASAPLLLASVPNEEVFPYTGQAYHFRHYTRTQFAALLAECGWRVMEWWGQSGPESEVEQACNGRTLIAVARRDDTMKKPAPKRAKRPARQAAEAPAGQAAPRRIAILALGPSVSQYLELVKRAGGRSKLFDEVWTINALGDVFDGDRVFHMDDVRIQEIRAAAKPDSNIAAMLRWLKRHPGPVITSRAHADYPGLVEFPLQAVINATGFAYFNSTPAYAIAYAIYAGVKHMALFGMDYTYAHSHHAEKGRACVEFWLGLAAARGIKFTVANQSSLLDACNPQAERLYGYDTVVVHINRRPDGRVALKFTERTPLPTAAEIEARYDHTAHVNPLVDKQEG